MRSAACPNLPTNVGNGNGPTPDGVNGDRGPLKRGIQCTPDHSPIGGAIGLCLNVSWGILLTKGKQYCMAYDGNDVSLVESDTRMLSGDLLSGSISTMETNAQSAADLCGPFYAGSITGPAGSGLASASASGAVGSDSYGRTVLVKEEGYGASLGAPYGQAFGRTNTVHVHGLRGGPNDRCLVYSIRKVNGH
jgi:hypothetical protein